MRNLILILSLLVSWPAFCQTAAVGSSQAEIDNLWAAMPQAADIIPPTDTLNGAIGASAKYMRQDAPRPTISQRTTVTTDATGNFTVTWLKSFASSTPAIFLTPLLAAAAAPITCVVQTRSASGLTGKCWQNATNVNALLSLTISLAPINFVSQSVMVIGLEPSQ